MRDPLNPPAGPSGVQTTFPIAYEAVTAAGGYSGTNTVTPWKRGGDTLPISTMAIANLRTDYALRGLTEADAGDDPFCLLEQWLADAIAAGVPEPTAMTLATCTPD